MKVYGGGAESKATDILKFKPTWKWVVSIADRMTQTRDTKNDNL